MSAANRRIVFLTDWTSAYPKALWTTSRKAETVSDRSRTASLLLFANDVLSIQHPDGFHLCHLPLVDHVETRHEEVGETGPLCCHVFGMLALLDYAPLASAQNFSNSCNREWSSQSQPQSTRSLGLDPVRSSQNGVVIQSTNANADTKLLTYLYLCIESGK